MKIISIKLLLFLFKLWKKLNLFSNIRYEVEPEKKLYVNINNIKRIMNNN